MTVMALGLMLFIPMVSVVATLLVTQGVAGLRFFKWAVQAVGG
jgi:hypothetical protein